MNRTPDWLVERLAANDLSPREAQEVRQRLEVEGGLDRLTALSTSNAALLEKHPAELAVPRIRRLAAAASEAPARRWNIWAPVTLVAVAAALTMVLLRPGTQPLVGLDDGDTTREKGLAPQLLVHRKSGAAVERLAPRAHAKRGDELQLSFVAAGRPFAAIVSVDGAGNVTQHWPEKGEAAAPVEGTSAVALPHAYVLDDAPAFERFVLLTSAQSFSFGAVLHGERGAPSTDAPLPLPAFVEQTSFLLVKETP